MKNIKSWKLFTEAWSNGDINYNLDWPDFVSQDDIDYCEGLFSKMYDEDDLDDRFVFISMITGRLDKYEEDEDIDYDKFEEMIRDIHDAATG